RPKNSQSCVTTTPRRRRRTPRSWPESACYHRPVPNTAAPGATFSRYVEELQRALCSVASDDVDAAVNLLRRARGRCATILFCGNGRSATPAPLFAIGLAQHTIHPRFGLFRSWAPNDNVALFSAWGNDNGYERVFVEQAANLLRPGDVLVAIS